MGKMIYVTGGARSGKSSYAEMLASKYQDQVTYIATAIPFDDEMRGRIERHRKQRPQNWKTVEAYKDLDGVLQGIQEGAVLLDCITVMITNLMMEEEIDWDQSSLEDTERVERRVQAEIEKMIQSARSGSADLILVSNETGMGLVPEYPMGRVFRDIAGRVNQRLAQEADQAYFLVSGIPMKLK